MSRPPLNNTKFAALRWQVTYLQKKVDEVANTFDQLELAADRLEERLKQRWRTLQRGSYLLHMMELFLHRPTLAALLIRYVSNFFQLLLSHIESEFSPEGANQITCIRQLWSRERRSKELRRCRHRFCQQRQLSSELLAVLTEIHDVYVHNIADLAVNTEKKRSARVEVIIQEIDDYVTDLTVATALKRTVMAVENEKKEM